MQILQLQVYNNGVSTIREALTISISTHSRSKLYPIELEQHDFAGLAFDENRSLAYKSTGNQR